MKQLKLFLIPLLVSLFSQTAIAADVTIKVNVSNPAALQCTVAREPREIVEGENTFTVAEYTEITFKAVSPYYITGVTDENGTLASGKGDWNIYPNRYVDGKTYTIATINLDEERDSEFIINVDDPTLVNAQLTGWNQKVNLIPGENTVRFSYINEQQLSLSSATSKPLYEVKLDGKKLTSSYGSYYTIDIEDGCRVDITAVIPDVDVTVNFKYSETGEGCIKSVSADGTTVSGFDGHSVTIKAGQQLTLKPNSDYKFDSVKINGASTAWPGTYDYTTTVMEDMEIEIDAHPWGKLPYKVSIDDPSNILFYQGMSYDSDRVLIELQPGENNLEIPENATSVSWQVVDGSYISSVTVNGNTTSGNYQNVTKDMMIEFVTGKINYDKQAVIWVDNTEATYYCEYQGSDNKRKEPVSGYNVVKFYDAMNPFNIGWYPNGGQVNKLYLDGELQSPQYAGSFSYYLTIPDQGVVKIFVVEEPVDCAVSFTADDDVQATVKQDIVKDVNDWRSGFNCFKGTQVNIAGEGIKVAVGGTDIQRNEDGDYVFTVADPETSVAITKDTNVGVESVIAEESDDDAVYTLMGVKAGTRSSMHNLAPGIYVVGGKKVVKK